MYYTHPEIWNKLLISTPFISQRNSGIALQVIFTQGDENNKFTVLKTGSREQKLWEKAEKVRSSSQRKLVLPSNVFEMSTFPQCVQDLFSV
jgi:hypothetical protein